MENLLFAKSFNCALLKEEVIGFIVKNKTETSDMLVEVMRGDKNGGSAYESSTNRYSIMSISDLRRLAHRK